ncbi:stealth family protein [Halomonas chromatireducens]|uniref:stealth family protein n=1 Tax=Halomonas chromatireducens TaxID=507626 RepID=UPI00130ECE01|nr:stealth family protein [Halomonas chromatireducens]
MLRVLLEFRESGSWRNALISQENTIRYLRFKAALMNKPGSIVLHLELETALSQMEIVLDIDAVITWVDGSDPKHNQKRNHWLLNEAGELHDNATDTNRWLNNNEIRYCLKSIEIHAPWFRKIWIVTDDQVPELSYLSKEARDKIKIIDHRHIFRGYEEFLPTFNSLSIETMLWRIEGLSDNFVYFNDDVFLVGPTGPTRFFQNNKPVLRGQWVDFTDIDEERLHRINKINSATMLGFNQSHFFASAHVAFPLKKRVLEELFLNYEKAFVKNISYRFRDKRQFLAQGVHDLFLIKSNNCYFSKKKDHVHIKKDNVLTLGRAKTKKRIDKIFSNKVRIACINDFHAMESEFVGFAKWIERAVGERKDCLYYLKKAQVRIRKKYFKRIS